VQNNYSKNKNSYKKVTKITVEEDELIVIKAPANFTVFAESSYGYEIGDDELRVDCSRKSEETIKNERI